MKKISRVLSLAVCMLFALSLCNSCRLGTPEDPDFPSYVSYSITGDVLSSNDATDQLRSDVKAWLKDNAIYLEEQVNYSTGDASEFAKTDQEAIKKYENQYMPKFRNFLNSLSDKLNSGTYGKVTGVKITFCTYARREQGKENTLVYEQHEFIYPSSVIE